MPLRPLRPDDAPNLALVEAAAWRHAYAGLLPGRALAELESPVLTRRWAHRLRDRAGGAWGVEEDGVVVAYATAGPARDADLDPAFAGEVAELYVHPGWQGRGHGEALLDHAWQALAAAGRRWGVLWVLRDNDRARAFYERQGMHADGHARSQKVPGGRVPTVRYARALQALDLAALLGARHDDPLDPP